MKEQTVTVVQNDVSAKRLITATICPSNITQMFFCKKPRSSHLRSRNERANELRASVSTRLVCEKLCRRAYERTYHGWSVLTTKEHGKAWTDLLRKRWKKTGRCQKLWFQYAVSHVSTQTTHGMNNIENCRDEKWKYNEIKLSTIIWIVGETCTLHSFFFWKSRGLLALLSPPPTPPTPT